MPTDWGWCLDLAGRRAQVTPDREAVIDGPSGRAFTYAELDWRANCLGNVLTEGLGLAPGDRVAVLARNVIEYFDLFFATQKTGLVLVPLNWRLTPSELAHMVRTTTPRLLAYEGTLAELATGVQELEPVDILLRFGRGAPGEDDPVPGSRELDALLAKASARLPHRATPLDPEDPHLILFTGGTTGAPKGAVISHRALHYNMAAEALSWDLGPADIAPNMLPFFHTGGWNLLTLPLLYVGARIIISPTFNPGEVLRWVDDYGCTFLFGAATMYLMMLGTEEWPKARLSSLRLVMSGAASCPRSVMEPFWARGLPFCQGYGITEGGPNNLYTPWTSMSMDMIQAKSASVGRPFIYCRARLAGDDKGAGVPVGQLGEILLSGPIIFSGYWQDPEATSKTLIDGWVWTGDIARQDEDGFFYIMDRRKDMFISGGENVFPVEIETVITQHPKVLEAAVVGVPDPKWGEVGKAFVVLKKGEDATPEDILGFLSGKLGRYKIPKHIEFVDALPKSGVGKILKRVLREREKEAQGQSS